MNKPIVAGNWKMHKTPQEGHSFVGEVANLLLDMEGVEVIFCPPFPALFKMDVYLQADHLSLGAQNCHWEAEGAFTGEVSTRMLAACNVDYVIVGHSERRHIFNEPDEWINKKVKSVLNEGLKPILCIGETLQERENGLTESVLTNQLTKGLAGVESIEDLVVAYEPVWAIGTGINAKPEQVAEAHRLINTVLEQNTDSSPVNRVPILYGGSVKPNNAQELILTHGVDGFLIGGASLKVEPFTDIVKTVAKHYVRK